MNSKTVVSTLYRREYLLTVDDDTLSPFQVVFKALSLKDLEFLRNFEDTKSIKNQLDVYLLSRGIVSLVNAKYADGTDVTSVDLGLLSETLKQELVNLILYVSIVTNEIVNKIYLNVSFAIDKKFQTETWDCDICRSKGIDTVRNCRFREDYDKLRTEDFSVYVGETVFKDCPMYYKDTQLTSDIFNCYYSYDKGVFPELGGLQNQTEFFVVACNIVKNAISKREAEEQ